MISPYHCPACNARLTNLNTCPASCVWTSEQLNSLLIAQGERPGWLEPKPPAANAPRLVLVEWLDSHYRPGWTTEAALVSPLTCRSVGWIVGQNPQGLVLSANISVEENVQRCGDITIPRQAIVSITDLKQPDRSF